MKKTLITLLALGGLAVGAAPEPIWTAETNLTSYSISGLDSFTIAVTLNVETLKAESGANFNGPAKIIDLSGVWNVSGLEGTLDINVNGSSTGKTSTLYIGGTTGLGEYKSNYALNGISGSTIFNSSTIWENITGAALVFVKDGSSDNDAVRAYFSLKYADGTTTTYEGANTGIKFTIDHDGDENTDKVADKHLNVSTISFENSFATEAWVYGSALSANDARTIAAALAPEPTTATLSLLALAGLAARRRRK